MSEPVLWVGFVMLIAIGMLSYNFNVTLQMFVAKGLHDSTVLYSFLLAVYAFGAVASALVVANKALVRMRHIIIGAAALGVTMLLLAVAPTFVFALPAAFLVGAASILYLTASTAILQVEGKKEMHGRIIALQTVVIGGGGCHGWTHADSPRRSGLPLGRSLRVLGEPALRAPKASRERRGNRCAALATWRA